VAESSVLAFEFSKDAAPMWVCEAEVWKAFTVGTPHTGSNHFGGCVKDEPAVHLGNVFDLVLEQAFGCVTHWRHGEVGFLGFG
jgi:hypothetical protein